MQLTEEQQDAVRVWAAEGLGLSDIQKTINAEFGIAMTYMDVRFLVIELGITLRDKPDRTAASAADVTQPPPQAGGPGEENQDPQGGFGGVAVELDVVTKPGSVVSGTVTFSDGVSASWFLDQMGRLAIDAGRPGYKPSEQDLSAFQQELRTALEKKGF